MKSNVLKSTKIVLLFTLFVNLFCFVGWAQQNPSTVQFYETSVPSESFTWLRNFINGKPEVSLKHYNSRLVISGESPRRKKDIANQFINWFGVPVINLNSLNWSNEIDITELLESKLNSIEIGKILPANGINCHGTSLYMTGLIPRLSYVDKEELNFYLDSYCEQIGAPIKDAVGVIDRKTIFSHSFKVISPEIIFQKKSVSREDGFRFNLINDFGKSEFFKCQKIPRNFCPNKYIDLKNRVVELDTIYSEIMFKGKDIERRKNAILQIEPLKKQVSAFIKNDTTPCRQDLLRLFYRLDSLESVAKAINGSGIYNNVGGLVTIEPKY